MEDTVLNYVIPGEEPTAAIQASMPYLYAYEFRRNCSVVTNQNCLEVSSTAIKSGEGFIPLKDTVVMTERMYNSPFGLSLCKRKCLLSLECGLWDDWSSLGSPYRC